MEIEDAIKIVVKEAEEHINQSEEKSIGKQQALALVKSMVQFFDLQGKMPDTPMPKYIPQDPIKTEQPIEENEL